MNKYGCYGEDRAADYLAKKGYKIIDRNWHCWGGEIDIIAQKENMVFVEVKYRKNQICGYSFESINFRKRLAQSRAIQNYLLKNNLVEISWQFDVITLDETRHILVINHYENVEL